MDFDGHGLARAVGRDDDFFDHAPEGFEDNVAGLAFADAFEMGAQFGDELAIAIGGGRVEHDGLVVLVEHGDLVAQLRAFVLEAAQLLHQGQGAMASGGQIDQGVDLLIEIGQAPGMRLALAGLALGQFAPRGVIFCDIGGDRVWVGQIGVERLEHAILDMHASDGPIVLAIAALTIAGTADAVIAHHGVAGAAAAAFGEAREEVARLGRDRPRRHSALGLAGLGEAENGAIDNRKVRRFALLPFRFRIEPRDPLARRRVLHEALPVPDDFPDIEPVLQDAIGARLAAIERGGIPFAAARPGHALGIERGRDLARGLPGDVVRKDAAHHIGFALADLMLARPAGHGAVAVGEAATRGAGRDPGRQAAAGLVAQFGQEDFGHQALEARMHGGDRAVADGHDADTEKSQFIADAVQVGLLAREAIQILADQNVEALFARHAQHAIEARPVERAGAGHGFVGKAGDDKQALTLSPAFAPGDLVFAGAFVLQIGAKAGVDRGAGHRLHPVRSPPDGPQWPAAVRVPAQSPAQPPCWPHQGPTGARLSIWGNCWLRASAWVSARPAGAGSAPGGRRR